jgi:hypothetical protein
MEGTLSDYTLEKSAEFLARYLSREKWCRPIGFVRGDEDERLQKMLEAIQNEPVAKRSFATPTELVGCVPEQSRPRL